MAKANAGAERQGPSAAQVARWKDPVIFCSELLHDPESKRPFVLYEAEREFLRRALAVTPSGRMKYSELVFSAPKKSGKTGLATMLGIYTAVVLAGQRGEIYCLANDLEQSVSRVYGAIVAILEASPLLLRSAKIVANKISFRANGTTITALPNDYRGFAGANPTLNIYDELAYYTSESSRRLWDEGVASPARKVSFRLSVSTAGFEGEASPLRALFDRARESGTEIAPDTRAHENLSCTGQHRARRRGSRKRGRREMQRTLRWAQYKRLICNEWTSSESAFVELADWDRCVNPDARPMLSAPGLSVWSGLDVGLRHDSTALVTVTRDEDRIRLVDHRIFVPTLGTTLDVQEQIESAVLDVQRRFDLRACAFDPWQAVDLSQRLQKAGVNMVEVPQNIPTQTQANGGRCWI